KRRSPLWISPPARWQIIRAPRYEYAGTIPTAACPFRSRPPTPRPPSFSGPHPDHATQPSGLRSAWSYRYEVRQGRNRSGRARQALVAAADIDILGIKACVVGGSLLGIFPMVPRDKSM